MTSKECKILYTYTATCCGGFHHSCWIIDGTLLVVWQSVSTYLAAERCTLSSFVLLVQVKGPTLNKSIHLVPDHCVAQFLGFPETSWQIPLKKGCVGDCLLAHVVYVMVQIKIVGNGYFQVLSFGSKAQYIVVYGTAILSDFLFLTVHRLSSL